MFDFICSIPTTVMWLLCFIMIIAFFCFLVIPNVHNFGPRPKKEKRKNDKGEHR